MTPYFLLKALCAFLREMMTGYLAAQGGREDFRVPEVYEWFLPLRNSKLSEETDFPYIAPRILKGEDIADRKGVYSAIHVEIAFGVYGEGKEVDGLTLYDGAYDLLNLMEHVRVALFRQPILDRKYQLEKPYTWEISDEQPYPLWVGKATSIWTIPNIYSEIGAKTLHDV